MCVRVSVDDVMFCCGFISFELIAIHAKHSHAYGLYTQVFSLAFYLIWFGMYVRRIVHIDVRNIHHRISVYCRPFPSRQHQRQHRVKSSESDRTGERDTEQRNKKPKCEKKKKTFQWLIVRTDNVCVHFGAALIPSRFVFSCLLCLLFVVSRRLLA